MNKFETLSKIPEIYPTIWTIFEFYFENDHIYQNRKYFSKFLPKGWIKKINKGKNEQNFENRDIFWNSERNMENTSIFSKLAMFEHFLTMPNNFWKSFLPLYFMERNKKGKSEKPMKNEK